MTDIARSVESAANLSAFDLGVYANQFLWNLDQAVMADSEPHRQVALGLIQSLEGSGAEFTEMITDAPLRVCLKGIKEHLPNNTTSEFAQWFGDMLSSGEGEGDDLRAGESWYSHFGVGRERKNLQQIIVNATLQTAEQRLWFQLGWLIDSGRHRPDTGNHVYRFNPRLLGLRPNPLNWLPNVNLPAAKQAPPLRTFEPGELPPQGGWWREVIGLCEQLKVSCNSNEPDLSTATAIVEVVEQLIESARTTIALKATATLTALSDGHQQSSFGSPIVGTARNDQEVSPDVGDGTGVLNGDSTEQRGGDSAVGELNAMMDSTFEPPQPYENQPQDTSAAIPQSATEREPKVKPEQERGASIGRWTIYQLHVQYGNLSRTDMTWSFRKVFQCLLEHNHNPVNYLALIEEGWGVNSGKGKKSLIPLISKLQKRLRNYLKDTLEVPLPKKLIHCRARGKDLCYQLNDVVR